MAARQSRRLGYCAAPLWRGVGGQLQARPPLLIRPAAGVGGRAVAPAPAGLLAHDGAAGLDPAGGAAPVAVLRVAVVALLVALHAAVAAHGGHVHARPPLLIRPAAGGGGRAVAPAPAGLLAHDGAAGLDPAGGAAPVAVLRVAVVALLIALHAAV